MSDAAFLAVKRNKYRTLCGGPALVAALVFVRLAPAIWLVGAMVPRREIRRRSMSRVREPKVVPGTRGVQYTS